MICTYKNSIVVASVDPTTMVVPSLRLLMFGVNNADLLNSFTNTSADSFIFSLNLAVRIFPSVSPLWHHDGGFTGAAGEGEDEVDDALLDDDNDAAADAAAPGGTYTTGPGWKCDPPFLGGPLRSIVAGIGCAPLVSLLSRHGIWKHHLSTQK